MMQHPPMFAGVDPRSIYDHQNRPTIVTSGFPPAPAGPSIPFSPVSIGSSTPYSPNMFTSYSRNQSPMTIPTPMSAASSYNPQDWSRSGPVAVGYIPHSAATVIQPPPRTVEASGMEAPETLPPPPPPYSPPVNGSAVAPPLPTQAPTPYGQPMPGMNRQNPNQPASRSLSRPPESRYASLGQQPGPAVGMHQQAAPGYPVQSGIPAQPAASRRAVSLSGAAIAVPSLHHSPPLPMAPTTSRPRTGWEQTTPIPPPPPGPPPAVPQSRNHPRAGSLNRITINTSPPSLSIPRRQHQSRLGDIPPTPIDWQDESDISTAPQSGISQTLDSASNSHSQVNNFKRIHQVPASAPATAAAGGPIPPSAWANHLVSSNQANGPSQCSSRGSSTSGLVRMGAARNPSVPRTLRERRMMLNPEQQGSPRISDINDVASGENGPDEDEREGRLHVTAPPPNPIPSHRGNANGMAISPGESSPSPILSAKYATAVAFIKTAAPTPIRPRSRSRILEEPRESTSSPHMPSKQSPRSAGELTPVSIQSNRARTPRDAFSRQCLTRFEDFLGQEEQATSDEQSIELFCRFIVEESQARRRRYSDAYDRMGSRLGPLMKGLWKLPPPPKPVRAPAPPPKIQQIKLRIGVEAPSNSRNMPTSPVVTSPLVFSPGMASVIGREGLGFRPSLSPIPSVQLGSAVDEESSHRGRSASRWWETNSSVSARRAELERSQRETKFMSVAPQAVGNLPWAAEPATPASTDGGVEPSSTRTACFSPISSPPSPESPAVDVSRLMTLPPPYPRHYPAVNNKHPNLTALRSIHRSLTELDEVKSTISSFNQSIASLHEKRQADAVRRENEARKTINERVQTGALSYSGAVQKEEEFKKSEVSLRQAEAQRDFTEYQSKVMKPLKALISDRITRATASIEELRTGLEHSLQDSTPNRPQEEGDEQPEVLERLTLLKWFFESREALYGERFRLEKMNSSLYKAVVITPFILAKDKAKIADVEDFFRQDGMKEKVRVEKDALARFEDLLSVVEANVTRGAEDQLSAFWDIAPGLAGIVQKIPTAVDDLDKLRVVIPATEFDENPEYNDHPLQYLFTLLRHAHMSAYQFIESQTNLFCLLHEVKSVVMRTNTSVLHMQRSSAGQDDLDVIEQETRAIQADEDGRLTANLKEKVGLVESQWMDGLGRQITVCEEVVQQYLESTGGWDDSLKE